MGRLMNIPVIGRLLRIAGAFIRAPQRFDALFEQTEYLKRREESLDADIAALRQRQDLDVEQFGNQLRVHSRFIEMQQDESRAMNARFDARHAKTEALLRRLAEVDPDYLDLVVDRICASGERLMDLNHELSTHATLWGSADRLHIAPSASVNACFFNTNSGSITIGENTFAGSRVSILAGSHDVHLHGFLRREADLTEGCDIVIGDGVWLGSGCTLLGPCTVGDNAVIAAGAVVAPGTDVPANTVYGGVKARELSRLDFSLPQDASNPHVLSALARGNGLLFVDGWSEKKIIPGIPCIGHWMTKPSGMLLVDRRRWTLYYALRDVERSVLIIEGRDQTLTFPVRTGPEAFQIDLPVEDGAVASFVFRLQDPEGKLFMMLIERRDDE